MLGISPEVAQHWLNIDPGARPVRQRPRKFAPDRLKAIVLVKKSNGSWKMCLLTFMDAFSGYNQI
uniref:Uncharacterized protein n=1 Tax=Musa acuminata subsp. malaccensis TaxID=214687 RepID=A0A804ICR1_MUSAM